MVSKDKRGHYCKNGIGLESAEENTIRYLCQFGFSIDCIKPLNIKRIKNPDVLLNGVVWEIKTPISDNKNTIKNRFRTASKQSTRAVFDLRNIKQNSEKVEKQIIGLFGGDGNLRKIIIVRKDGVVLEYSK